MKPIEALSEAEARELHGLLFDLDDTLLDHGALTERAYAALFRLREAGFKLYAVTGRPAGWGEVVARQWPVDGAVTENGAVAVVREGRAVRRVTRSDAARLSAERARVTLFLDRLLEDFPELELTDDNTLRLSDITLDIGEHATVAPEVIGEIERRAHAAGLRTTCSSVHLHLSLQGDDKASGAVRLLSEREGVDPTAARLRYAFIGDSQNDAACFAAFRTTIGVQNLSGRLTLPPRFVTSLPRGAGFAEAASVLLSRRGAAQLA